MTAVYSINQLIAIYPITDSAVRTALARGKLVAGVDCYKQDGRWHIYASAADKRWGHLLPVGDGMKRCRQCRAVKCANRYEFVSFKYQGRRELSSRCRDCYRPYNAARHRRWRARRVQP